MIKAILIVCLILFNGIGFSQFTQDWNYQNHYNPATSGFYYKHEANIATYIYGASLSGAFQRSLVTYSTLIKSQNIGLGFSYQNERYPGFADVLRSDNEIILNANKQFEWTGDKLLSIGLGAGVAINSQQYYDESLSWVASVIDFQYSDEPIFTSDIGLAFKWKRWNTNFSVNHFLNNRASLQNPKYLSLAFYTEYVFGKKEGFQIRPQVSIFAENGFQRLKPHLQFSYQSRFFVGLGTQNGDSWFTSAAIVIKDKFRLGYSYGWLENNLNNGVILSFHDFGLAFLLNRKDTY